MCVRSKNINKFEIFITLWMEAGSMSFFFSLLFRAQSSSPLLFPAPRLVICSTTSDERSKRRDAWTCHKKSLFIVVSVSNFLSSEHRQRDFKHFTKMSSASLVSYWVALHLFLCTAIILVFMEAGEQQSPGSWQAEIKRNLTTTLKRIFLVTNDCNLRVKSRRGLYYSAEFLMML